MNEWVSSQYIILKPTNEIYKLVYIRDQLHIFSFSLTLIDSLDTLVVLGDVKEFERGVKLVIDTVSFDKDFAVSVFETNIRVVG